MTLEELINLNAYIRKEYKLKTVLNFLLRIQKLKKKHKPDREKRVMEVLKIKKKIFIESQ